MASRSDPSHAHWRLSAHTVDWLKATIDETRGVEWNFARDIQGIVLVHFGLRGLCLGIMMAGCASAPPTAEELASADYGSPISQQQAQALAREFLMGRLKDPGSARYQWGNVHRGWLRHAPVHGGRIIYGYVLDVQVNAKNSFGGYVGYKPYRFVFFDGSIKTVYGERELSPGATYMGKLY